MDASVPMKSRSSFRSTTKRTDCRACSSASTRRSTGSKTPYEVVFIDDGSRDRSAALLSRTVTQRRPDVTRAIHARRQLPASIMAMHGRLLEHARGQIGSSLWTPTCRIRPRKSAKLHGGHATKATTTSAAIRRHAQGQSSGGSSASKRDEPRARTHHAHQA
jgi:hypothetical protein